MSADLESLRYPIGKFQRPENVTAQDKESWMRIIAELPKNLRSVVEYCNDEQLDRPYRPEGWTLRQVVHHLADSHMNAYCRFRLALTEDNPTIKAYVEARWAELPDAMSSPVHSSLSILDGIHERWSLLLQSMSDADWQRTFVHPQSNRVMSLEMTLALYAWHSRHHIAHIQNTLWS